MESLSRSAARIGCPPDEWFLNRRQPCAAALERGHGGSEKIELSAIFASQAQRAVKKQYGGKAACQTWSKLKT
jgi:hypothetical protein